MSKPAAVPRQFALNLFASAATALAISLSACTQTDVRPQPENKAEVPADKPRQREEVQPAEQAAAPATAPSPARTIADALWEHRGAELEQRMTRMESLGMPSFAPLPPPFVAPQPDRENYTSLDTNPVQRAAEQPVSTFSVDVDTASYANVRRYLMNGRLPPSDAVRVEELINYFDYGYTPPRDRSVPFSMVTEIAPTPWNTKTHLLHVGIQGWVPEAKPVGSNLVFLVDVSGSMQDPDKLPLVKTALKLLVNELGPKDRISLVVYAGASGVVLEPTRGSDKATILTALDRLEAGGSTNGAAGIELAYAMAKQGWIENGVNRVLLATDGDFNVGVTRFESLLDLVKEKRKTGIALTTLGFGEGNYNDHLMEQLADTGDGNHAYIDSAQEAHKVLVRQREGTLTTIARDVKIQVEFNPAAVAEYRLIGYENRMLKREDFSNDAVDAGDIGAGHAVTALYEVALVGSGGERIEPLRYGDKAGSATTKATELAHLRLRYKRPEDGTSAASHLIERPLPVGDIRAELAGTTPAFRFAAAVAGFGQLLAGGVYGQSFDYTAVERLAQGAGEDRHGDRGEFRKLVQLAGSYSLGARGEIGKLDEMHR
ncbi:MAG: vWA domain-containing protein [Panacagrimonas sp.]